MQIPIVSLVPGRFFFPTTLPFGTCLESVWFSGDHCWFFRPDRWALLSVKDRSGWSNDKVGQYLFFHVSGESLPSILGSRSKDIENGIHHLRGKREAEADPQYFFNYPTAYTHSSFYNAPRVYNTHYTYPYAYYY